MYKKSDLTLLDFFCGAGGFSEGFRQQGFKIVAGYDHWKPAVDTHNLNHDLHDQVTDLLEFEGLDTLEDEGLARILKLPKTTAIVGSPPCISFSMSNKAGKADKTLGLKLIEVFLRIVAVKKHEPFSKLQVWFMENVPNSQKHVEEEYSFAQLNLGAWARSIGLKPGDAALRVKENGEILNSHDFGSPQSRERFICGEYVKTGKYLSPVRTHVDKRSVKDATLFCEEVPKLAPIVVLQDILGEGKMPSPKTPRRVKERIADPNYPSLTIEIGQLTDHFYDTGIYRLEWESARKLKINHGFMGKMSFPEDMTRPSRTILATRSPNSRESILYKSEYKNRRGDGEYRLPTIREAATLMGFPFTYQFVGSEHTKWRQIGNAVCPHLSAALAKAARVAIGLKPIPLNSLDFTAQKSHYRTAPKRFKDFVNLNDYQEKKFNEPPVRKVGSRFRDHPFKDGNMTVALQNKFDEKKNVIGWETKLYLGTGKYDEISINGSSLPVLERVIVDQLSFGKSFIKDFKSKFDSRISSSQEMQRLYERSKSTRSYWEPSRLVKAVGELIRSYADPKQLIEDDRLVFAKKKRLPQTQVLAMFALDYIASKANSKSVDGTKS